jgi:hypothetical protein
VKPKVQSLIYTILANAKPVAALEATGPEGRELLKERWFLEELVGLKIDGEPRYKSGTRLGARPASEEEWQEYDKECKTDEDADAILFVYLVDLDRNLDSDHRCWVGAMTALPGSDGITCNDAKT